MLGVFCIFSTFGIASDILDMGREPVLHYVLGVFLAGSFSIIYALCGFILRKDFWKAFLPIFAVHFMLMNVLARALPTSPRLVQMGGSEIARLHNRLMFDALAVVAAMALGYAFFLFFFITEGRRYFRVHAEMALAAEIHACRSWPSPPGHQAGTRHTSRCDTGPRAGARPTASRT